VGVVKLLVEAGAEVDRANELGDTPLIVAALQGEAEIVSFLAPRIVAIDRSNQGETALGMAVTQDSMEMMAVLLEVGANPNTRLPDGKTALMKAGDRGNIEMMEKLINAGADVNLQDDYGATALMWSCHRGYLDAVKVLLICNDLDLSIKNQGGYTALKLAERNQYPEVVELLRQAGAED
jgi:uncharacterized protein